MRAPTGSRLARAGEAAAAAGVTRLADLTGLDRIGYPVWQAVRPMSRALSVHQGKGLDRDAAQIGALLEAVESDRAERFEGAGPVCRWADLPADQRPADLRDFVEDRAAPADADASIRWVLADRLGGGALAVPFDGVSLDFTRGLESPFDRSSNGVATGVTPDAALLAALCELVERDAVREWRETDLLSRMGDRIELATVPYAWLADLRAAIDAAGAWLACYALPSPAGLPVMLCEVTDYGKASAIYGTVWGSGSHPDPETALLRAVGEALQTRVTLIAGARDDCLPSAYAGDKAFAFGLPPPPGWRRLDWVEIPAGPALPQIAERLADAGIGPVASVELGNSFGFVTVRVFAPGLAGLERRRRL